MNTPRVRQYAPFLPMPNICDCGCSQFPVVPGNNGNKQVIILAGPGIDVDDLSDTDAWRFRVSGVAIEDLSVALTLVAKAGGVTKANPVLIGTTIDRVEFTWTINRDVASQTLENDGSATEPSLLAADRSKTITVQTITGDVAFTLAANDGQGTPHSIGSDVKSILFGNDFYHDKHADFLLTLTSSLVSALSGFSKTVKTSRVNTYFPVGVANEHDIIGYPKRFGLATFTKGIFSGGYIRLKNVGGTLKSELGDMETESDILVTNAAGHQEAYYFYQSLYDNQADNVTPFVVS